VSKKTDRDDHEEKPTGGLGGMIRGLGDLLEKLGQVAETGAEIRREGKLDGLGGKEGLHGVYGFTFRVGGAGADRVRVEPFGNLRKNAQGRTTVAEEREPLVDVFDEPTHVLVVAEMPGVEEAGVKTELNGDVLVIAAEAKDRKYRKEVLLPRPFEAAAMSRAIRNGMLEVRLDKGTGGPRS